jgi:transcriptional regulator NrdR family protein
MEGLMHLCTEWGTPGCHPEVSKLSIASEVKEGEDTPIWPVGEELRRLDNICKKCKERFFIADEEQCPYCDSRDVERTGGSHNIPGEAVAYGFRCNECNENFWINEKNLTP